ncbi:MAG: thiamine-phosphate kinase [Desulfopila sp.]
MHERKLIQSILEQAQVHGPAPLLKKGIGDDCAIFANATAADWLVSADMLVEDVHFSTSWHPPFVLGRKSLAVNISDIAAMGGQPRFALLCIGLPPTCEEAWTAAFMAGVFSQLAEQGCTLIGGDTVAAAKITISVTVLGTVGAGGALTRDGAHPGDVVYVSGTLGSAAAGLYLLKNGLTDHLGEPNNRYRRLTEQLLDPMPQLELARILQQSGMVTAMQDISDGIATDLSHICTASGQGARIFERALPADEELLAMCREFYLEPTPFQVKGGEDYQLLFTAPKECGPKLERLVSAQCGRSLYRVGEICPGQGVSLVNRSGLVVAIDYQGYEHRA